MLRNSRFLFIAAGGAITWLSISLIPIHLVHGRPASKVTTATREIAAKTLITRINAEQHKVYAKGKKFRSKFNEFPFLINPDAISYEYNILIQNDSNLGFPIAIHYAIARRPGLKSYIGAVQIRPLTDQKGTSTQRIKISSIICQSIRPSTVKSDLQVIFTDTDVPFCAAKSVRVGGID